MGWNVPTALGHAFHFSERLLCFIHARWNVKEKCWEFFIPTDGAKVSDTYIEGLVDDNFLML